MRINEIVLPKAGAFKLFTPQDGTTSPAMLRRAAATRGAQAQITALCRPNGKNALSSINSAEILLPKVIKDAAGAVTYGSPLRLQITARVGYDATEAELADLKSILKELINDANFTSFLIDSDRMI